MWKVVLTMKEQSKYEVIQQVGLGRKTKRRAAVELGLSVRQVDRLTHKYLEEGKQGFLHGNVGRAPSNKLSKPDADHIVNLFRGKYQGFNIRHFHEHLITEEEFTISETSLRRLLRRRHIASPKAQRRTKRAIKKELEEQNHRRELSQREKKQLIALEEVDPLKVHPTKPRARYVGELIQMDASCHNWFGENEEKATLHAAIDDNSGTLVGMHFEEQETLHGYYQILNQILTQYGVPAKFLTDRRTVFDYQKRAGSPTTENPLTQFGYACQQLGVALEVTSIPQAKGRVERLFETLQSRLVSEFKLHNIHTIEEANQFLIGFVKQFNQQFASPIQDNMGVFEARPTAARIDQILARVAERTVSKGNTIRFANRYYQTHNETDVVFLPPKTKMMVIQTLSNKLYATAPDGTVYALVEVPKVAAYSAEFDLAAPVPKASGVRHIPAANHPWRLANYRDYLVSTGFKYLSANRIVYQDEWVPNAKQKSKKSLAQNVKTF